MDESCLNRDSVCRPRPIPECDSEVIRSETLGECDSKCYDPVGICGPLVAKVPVVLSDVKVQIDIEADIRLEEPAFDIKAIDKKVCITQCHLVPCSNKLFIGGFVQANIQYSTVRCVNETSISGDIRHTTVNIPFKCVTKVRFDKKPIFGRSYEGELNSLDNKMTCSNDEEESRIHFQKFHEKIFCELEWAKILESTILNRDIRCTGRFKREKCFREFTEKIVVYVRLKVLQNQPVYVPKSHWYPPYKDHCECEE